MPESRSKYTIKRHKPELPQEQKILVENLQTKVLRVVDEIIVAIRQRHPRTTTTTAVVSWDHGGPHDAEIRARRGDIAEVIKRGVEEGFCFQNDSNTKLTGLFSDAQRKIAILRKMNEEKKCAFCQNQGTAGTAGRKDVVTREEGAVTEEATVEGGGSGSSTAAVPNPSSSVVQDVAPAAAPAGKGGAKDGFEKSKSSSSSGVRNAIEDTESKEKKNMDASSSLPCGGFKCPTWNILLSSQEGEDEHHLDEQMAREGMRLLSRLTDDNNNNISSVPDIATNSRRKSSKCAIAPAVAPNTFYMGGGFKEAGEQTGYRRSSC